MLKAPSLPLKERRHPLLNIDGTGLCALVNIGSIFYTSVQGTYFYQVIFGTKFKFSENQSTLRFHYPYWATSILLSQGIMCHTKFQFSTKFSLLIKIFYSKWQKKQKSILKINIFYTHLNSQQGLAKPPPENKWSFRTFVQ